MSETISKDRNKKPVKVHFALVGKQTYPVYLGIMETHADSVFLIHSAQTKEEAEHIAEVIGNGVCKPVEFSTDNIHSIINAINEKIVSQMSDGNQYTFDISGSIKLWSVLIYKLLCKFRNATFIYIDQIDTIYDITHTSQRKARVLLNMDLLFKLYGAKLSNYTALTAYTRDDFKACSLIANKIFSRREFISAFDVMANPQEPQIRAKIKDGYDKVVEEKELKGKSKKFAGSSLIYRPKDKYEENRKLWLDHADITVRDSSSENKPYTVALDAPHLMDLLFFAGWFELYVAKMLSKWKPGSDIRMDVSFDYENKNKTQNEVNIIMNTGHRLLFVECMTQSKKPDELDKFFEAVRSYGGMGSIALCVSFFHMDDDALSKCKDRIVSFSIEDARNEYLKGKEIDWHTMSPGERSSMKKQIDDDVQRQFNLLLDASLQKSNKK